MPMITIEIWTPDECYQCGHDLDKGAPAMQDTETDLNYGIDCGCGPQIEEYDYEQTTRFTTYWN